MPARPGRTPGESAAGLGVNMATNVDYFEVIARHRTDEIVVTTMSSYRDWPPLSTRPELDFNYLPSAMSHAPDIGLGLALSRPERRVIVLNGDGSLVMNLGCLVTAGI